VFRFLYHHFKRKGKYKGRLSFNVYYTISGTTAVGAYNVKSDGTPW
jgi:hypothetical protein